MTPEQIFESVAAHARQTALLETTSAVIQWDERTGLPSAAGSYRAEQIQLLSGLIHRRKTDPWLGEQLEQLSNNSWVSDQPHSPPAASVLRMWKDFRRNSLVPVELVEAISLATTLGQQAWESARARSDWREFAPHLQAIFDLRRREAEILRADGSLYDALLDQYEEGARCASLSQIFAQLRDDLVQLVRQLHASGHAPSGNSWQHTLSLPQQQQVSRWIAARIGYDFERGRLDETSHPFCTTLGPDDCRILTRYQANYFPSAFYSTLHEAGHGLYEQGLPSEWFGLPAGSYSSLGVHESQSRLWENFVGRSHAFWQWGLPEIQNLTGGWAGLNALDLYRDANRVEASLIRVEADEVTYNLHILIRFEIEQALLEGTLAVGDAPQAWQERYLHYLGIQPSNHRDGILQDVHWSAGLIGYFPTYTLGNLYAAQLMEAMSRQLGNLDDMLAHGEFAPCLDWLRQTIHTHGACYHPSELVAQACGESLSHLPLVNYLRRKLSDVYQV